tara:strand:+ start:1146 stop:1358 length:213 start_codon:yes stop_codon:yes gene_type:complete
MKKVKLPRKRKKAYKKSKSKSTYLTVKLLKDILFEELGKYYDRFYELQIKKKGEKGFDPYNNGYLVTKRW